MTFSKKELLSILPFKLNEESLDLLVNNISLVKFSVGQEIIEKSTIPAKIFIIKSGYARLLGEFNNKLRSIHKYSEGSLLGQISIINNFPMEYITATEDLIAYSVDQVIFHKIYSNDKNFNSFINENLFPQEIFFILNKFLKETPRTDFNFKNLLDEAKNSFKKFSSVNTKEITSDVIENYYFYSKENITSDSITEKKDIKIILKNNSDFQLYAVPKNFINNLSLDLSNVDNKLAKPLVIGKNIQDAGKTPISRYVQSKSIPKDFKLILSKDDIEADLATYQMLAKLMKLPLRKDAVKNVFEDIRQSGKKPTLQIYGQIAAALGLHVIKSKVPPEAATRLQSPSLIIVESNLLIVLESNDQGLLLASSKDGYVKLNKEEIIEKFAEGIDYLTIDRVRTTPVNRFGFTWFIPALKKYRSILIQVFAASFIVQLFTLANPLLIQVIIDKVISQRSLDTLQVLGIALLVLTLIEGVLGSLKTFLFVETTNRIDQRLGSEVIDHLLRLPLEYFDKRPVGELGTRIAELEKIRNFITGQGLSAILDAAFSLIYIIVMIIYSLKLTLIALIVLPIQIGLTIIGAPLFRKQFRESAEDNAKTQSHLVEVITGIQTVKAQNIETTSRWKWQELYSKYIASTFRKLITGTALTQTSQVLQKISQLLVLWIGASMVLEGNLTLGQLIAFRIISGYVTQPILRLSTIWQNIQELRISFERLGDVINTEKESDEEDRGKIPLPAVRGNVSFKNLEFKFPNTSREALKNVNLDVTVGTFVGIVGKSGSGKSTLVKLLSRLYSPTSGNISIDNFDIDKVELYSLRRQIGIVPQEPLLFSGTIAENISLNQEDASNEDIIKAAKLASCHDFIMELPAGYNSQIGERGTSMSGGQRQRIAIARTLLLKPKILIMDEATSALDYFTERNVVENLKSFYKDSTIFFITHRLATVSSADVIVMMEDGALIEKGNHETLLNNKGAYYSLYNQQESAEIK